MDSITTRQNNDPVNSEVALDLCLQLCQQGGLIASKAALLLAAVPALRSLLQPIIQLKKNDAETDIVSAFITGLCRQVVPLW